MKKQFNYNGEIWEADKIVKDANDIIGYDLAGNELFSFRGISDFSLFNLEQGQTWDIDEKEQFAILKNKLMTADERYKALDKTTVLLADLKAAKMAQLDELCNKAIVNGFDCDVNGVSYHFSCSPNAQLNFTGTQYKFDKGEITSIGWTAIENSTGKIVRITLDTNTFKPVADKVLPHVDTNINKLRNTLQPQVESATDNTSVDAIVW